MKGARSAEDKWRCEHCQPQDRDPGSARLTEWDAQVARYKGKIDDLRRYPQRPQRFTRGPDLITPFVIGMLHGVGPLLHNALHQEEGGEVQERVAAAPATSIVKGCQTSTLQPGTWTRGKEQHSHG